MLLYLEKLQTFAATTLNIDIPQVYAASKDFIDGQGLTAVEKYSIKNAVGTTQAKFCMQVQMCVEVNIVGSQDTTGLMTCRNWSLWLQL
jgi:aconitate hydratase 2/2-methylisocitrate dehydratase